jgi:hypothetical protein
MDLYAVARSSLQSTCAYRKILSNGVVEWYDVPDSRFNIILTRWLDDTIHMEYRNMSRPSEYTIIYSDIMVGYAKETRRVLGLLY